MTTEFPQRETPEAYLERVLATWVGRLRLQHWEIKIDWSKPAGDESNAECTRSDYYDEGTIQVDLGNFREWSPRLANEYIVHELMHLLTRDLSEAVKSVEGLLPKSALDVFMARFKHEEEGVVDRTARLLVELGGIV